MLIRGIVILFSMRHSGEYIAPFGVIGQGPAEIPANSYGYLSSRCFTVFNDQTGVVMKYSLDSLRSGQPNACSCMPNQIHSS